MTRFTDGPAAGIVLSLRRAPPFLRVVRDAKGRFDALDQLDDEPKASETVTVYRKTEDRGTVHINRGRHGSGFFPMATYALHAEQPDEETARDNARWAEWAHGQANTASAEAKSSLPDTLDLYFAGSSRAGVLCWAWALMDAAAIHAQARGTVDSPLEQDSTYPAVVGLDKACAYLAHRGWRGTLTIRSHQHDAGIFSTQSQCPLTRRVRELLAGIQWRASRVGIEENEFCYLLLNEAYGEWMET